MRRPLAVLAVADRWSSAACGDVGRRRRGLRNPTPAVSPRDRRDHRHRTAHPDHLRVGLPHRDPLRPRRRRIGDRGRRLLRLPRRRRRHCPTSMPSTRASRALPALDPDLVILSFDPGDLVGGLGALGIPTLVFDAPATAGGRLRPDLGDGGGHRVTPTAPALVGERCAPRSRAIVTGLPQPVRAAHLLPRTRPDTVLQPRLGHLPGLALRAAGHGEHRRCRRGRIPATVGGVRHGRRPGLHLPGRRRLLRPDRGDGGGSVPAGTRCTRCRAGG